MDFSFKADFNGKSTGNGSLYSLFPTFILTKGSHLCASGAIYFQSLECWMKILIGEATSSDQYGHHCLSSLFCWGFHCWYEDEDCQNVVSLNNRNTDRQLPSLEGVRLKSWSILLCNICIKMAGSAPAPCRSLSILPFKCLFSRSVSKGSTIATSLRCEYVDEIYPLRLTPDM